MTALIDVQLCDDHEPVRSALRRLIEGEPGLTVTGEASNADEAIERVRGGHPDVLLLDVMMPGRSGIEALPEIVAAAPGTKVLILSMQDEPAYVRRAFAAGAHGYLLKDAADAELVLAIREVAAGGRYVQPALVARLEATEAAVETPVSGALLSDREHEVLRLLALGHTNREIAELLLIPVPIAETHRETVMEKLGLRTRAEVVRHVATLGEPDVVPAALPA